MLLPSSRARHSWHRPWLPVTAPCVSAGWVGGCASVHSINMLNHSLKYSSTELWDPQDPSFSLGTQCTCNLLAEQGTQWERRCVHTQEAAHFSNHCFHLPCPFLNAIVGRVPMFWSLWLCYVQLLFSFLLLHELKLGHWQL